MGRRGGRWRPSGVSITSVVVAAGLGLVGNLATSTVEMSQWWWPIVTWSGVGVLLVAAVVVEVIRHRSEADDAESAESDVRVFGAIPRPAWHWQERPAEAEKLRGAMGRKGRAALVALPGQRGVGKSQLAAQYARQCIADRYDLVAWINAESGPVTDLAELAERLGLRGGVDLTSESLAAAVRGWLERDDGGRRLVVFDNVDTPEALDGFLPSTGPTKVLITTNRREFTTLGGVIPVEIGMFTKPQGLAFLREATERPDSDDAVALGKALGWLPLGLAQATALIKQDKLSYPGYLTALNGERLDDALVRLGTDHLGVLRATQLSLARVRRDDPGGDAVRLLTVLSVLSPDGVSRTLLTQAESALALKRGLARALHTLGSWSLITLAGPEAGELGGDGVVVSVHRLTARVIRHHAGKPPGAALATAIDTATRMLGTLADAFPAVMLTHRRAEVDEIVAHTLAVCGHSSSASPDLLDQCNWAGRALHEVGDLARAIPVLDVTLADRVRVLGSDHPDTLVSRNNLARAYRSAGRLGEAIPLYEATLADRVRVLGSDHPSTLRSRNNLAYAYRSAGRLGEAIDLFRAVLADRVRVLGSDHPSTLVSRHNLAGAYESVGRLGEAIGLYEAVLADRVRVLGADHPDTLMSGNNLASAYRLAGRLGEAIGLYEAVLADRVRVLGADHPDTLMSRNNLAYAYESVGRLGEAISLLEATLADCERVLGPDHPTTALVRDNLAVTRQRQRGQETDGPESAT